MIDPRRLPYGPLRKHLLARSAYADDCVTLNDPEAFTSRRAAELCGVAPETIRRWDQHGLSIKVADEVCGRLNVHPAELWPEWDSQPVTGLRFDVTCPDCGGEVRWRRPMGAKLSDPQRIVNRCQQVSCDECLKDWTLELRMREAAQ